MPNDTESRPPILDYRPVTNDRMHIPKGLTVFLMGVAAGLVWTLAIVLVVQNPLPQWVVITVYPGRIIGDLIRHEVFWQKPAALLPVVTIGVSYGLLALLLYAVYRRLRRLRDGKPAAEAFSTKFQRRRRTQCRMIPNPDHRSSTISRLRKTAGASRHGLSSFWSALPWG